ncbi:amino acid ABC transporter ATP-binding protein [Pectobacterium polonicum]|uniref:Amino acid ABC transporter ATP-binding protein n=1 Tax=Pectobacterium polonicum TaxID=2485124 RepID=A0AAE9NQ82_9GAMM|nr:amino acid ABC transporter ATP-binding protein [Pectobacterium polonicum]MDC9821675.1 amino acid ABC transporter ATP-binding protein [Pectobacterium polonicum]UVO08404.1 amino acid ABC transporter ATP-binding protein [Pectobacterium polonicum]GKW24685.1 histidine ABC transporter ATP-binding protein [Pectobacterium carotovorum subsp. carotovorum]
MTTPFLSDAITHNRDDILRVSHLSKHYGAVNVLHDISLQARKGDVISLLGRSGSGKSTLLRCLNFLELADTGNISLLDETISLSPSCDPRHLSAAITRLRRRMGMVFQNYRLWPHLTLLQNITEVPIQLWHIPKQEAIEQAEHLLQRVGLYQRKHHYPSQLSGGQQQRGAIARALAVNPEILLLDEPTSALDPELVGEVLAVIRSLAQEGRTMVIVTHEIAFARDVSDQILFLHQGRIDTQGSPDALFSGGGSDRFNTFIQAI